MSKSVLIVDDQQSVREIVRSVLDQWPGQVNVQEAADGEEALQSLGRRKFDLVILDIHMPGRDGFEVLREIRATPATADLAVLMLTSEDSPESIASGIAGAATGYLTKPFNLDDLQEALREHLSL